jgi:predicted deacylase
MTQIPFSKPIHIEQRVIGDVAGLAGPTMVIVGGIHGNEHSGILALQQVFQRLEAANTTIKGRLIGVAGNLPALAVNERFISRDLNRLWNHDFTSRYKAYKESGKTDSDGKQVVEFQQQYELFEIIEPLLSADPPTFVLDLHTTSSKSAPFIAINDRLENRNFALQFPVKTVLGIEEHLSGPLLSYLSDRGNVAVAFEAGQHDAAESVDLHVAFICQAMVVAGVVGRDDLQEAGLPRAIQSDSSMEPEIFEVTFRQAVSEDEEFTMKPGFTNFTSIEHGCGLASNRDGPILSPQSGRIFMPLYQGAGNDGFFIVRKVPKWALSLSTLLRKTNFDRLLAFLPGVSRSNKHPDALIVNKKITFLFATKLFHLLGYRRKKEDGSRLIFSRREIAN